MGLREEALAAAAAAAANRETAARAVLASVLAPSDTTGLEVVAELDNRLVFSGDDVHLAVRDEAAPGDRVSLVDDGQGWTHLGEVTSLACLGRLLAG